MKKICLLASCLLWAACTNEVPVSLNENAFWQDRIPTIARMVWSEISHLDVTVECTDTYTYKKQRLDNHTTRQAYMVDNTPQSFEITNQWQYTYATDNEQATQAILTTYSGNTATYLIDEEGYAKQCTYQLGGQTRTYRFDYTNGYLTRLEEDIDGKPYSTLTFHYQDQVLIGISTPDNRYRYEPDRNTTNPLHLPPCLHLLDIYPLNLHIDALMAHLLGKQSAHFVRRITIDGNPDEYTGYTYQWDNHQYPTAIYSNTTTDTDGSDIVKTRKVSISYQ